MESAKSLKRFIIIFINVVVMAGILIFVVLYSRFESTDSYRRQIENFENTTGTMEQVTANYLEGEQRVCDVWAQYINSRKMTVFPRSQEHFCTCYPA